MISVRNKAREKARVIHDITEFSKQPAGSLWRESPIDPKSVGCNGGNPGYVLSTGSGKPETAYVVFCLGDGSGYTTDEEHGIFLPQEHQLTFPLTEVTDGSKIVIKNK